MQAHLMHQLLMGPQLLALFLLLLEELFLLKKKKMQARQEIPHFYFEQIFAFTLYLLLFYLFIYSIYLRFC